jgi:transcriptional regulator with XRE-family HTH domain
MIDIAELKGKIAKKGLSQRKVASKLGISENTFYAKMKKGVFESTEMEAMIELLEIRDPMAIFFAKSVS